jgi:glycosyltransferase involved in cell wall biosynthesis
VGRYLDGIAYCFRARRVWKKEVGKIDAVLLQSTQTVAYTCFFLNRYLKKPIVFNSFDIFPDVMYMMGALNNRLVYKVLSKLQDYAYRSCAKIVVISEDMKKSFIGKGIPEENIVIIRNWFDSNYVKNVNAEENKFINDFKLEKGKFRVQYAGNFGYTFNHDAVIEIAKLLKKYPEIEFDMVGNGGFEKTFKEKAESNGLDNIRFFPWQPLEVISDVYSACDMAIVPLSKGVINNSFPSKCSLLMACRKTFLCLTENDSFYYKWVNKNNVGICVNQSDYKKAAQAIVDLWKNPDTREKMENNAYRLGWETYSSNANSFKYVEVFKNL